MSILAILAIMVAASMINIMLNLSIIADSKTQIGANLQDSNQQSSTSPVRSNGWIKMSLFLLSFPLIFALMFLGIT